MSKSGINLKRKESVLKTLELLDNNGFIKDISDLTNNPIFYKCIHENIYVVFCYANSTSKNYDIHCFDLFISHCNGVKEIRKEVGFGKFWIGSFYVDKEIHMNIFNELMSYHKEMQSKNQFELLDRKYSDMYFNRNR